MAERVLVIGAGGFIGSAISSALLTGGYAVRGVSRTARSAAAAGFEHIAADCHDPSAVASLLDGCSAIVYLAASSTPGSSMGQPLAELEGNLRPLLALLEALQQRPELPLLYFSSAGALYGERGHAAFTEHDLPRPKSYHGAAKVAAEQFIGAWCRQYGGAATILRPSNIYGPGQPERAGFGIIPHAFGMILRGQELTVWGDGSSVRDYLYIDDLAALAVAVLQQPMPAGIRVFNAASGDTASLNELFALLEVASGKPLQRRYEQGRAVDAGRVAIDAREARDRLGWQPSVTLVEGLGRTWRWLNTNPG